MLIKLNTYHRYVNYWNSYGDEVNIKLIVSIVKGATWALVGFSETTKLYAIYLVDGEKLYTDYAGFRRVLKAARENGVTLDVR